MDLFDFDGTLVDSNGVWVDVDNGFLARRGLTPTREYSDAVGHSIFPIAAQYTKDYYHLDMSPEEIMAEWLDMARDVIAEDAMAQQYERKFYQNGARLSGIVKVDTDAKPETREKIRRAFARYATEDQFKVAVLDHGMEYTPLGVTQVDAQYLESRGFTVEEVARFTGIPKHMLQTGKESYDSNQQQRVNWVTDTVVPFVTQWEQEEGRKLLTRLQRSAGVYIHGNVSVLLRGDDMSRSQFYERMIRNAIYNPDECRALEERPPIPGGLGQEFVMSKNMGSLRSIVQGDGNDGA